MVFVKAPARRSPTSTSSTVSATSGSRPTRMSIQRLATEYGRSRSTSRFGSSFRAEASREGGEQAVVVSPGDVVLVAGATGGVGQVLTQKLVERGFRVKALSRSRSKSMELLGNASNLEHLEGDITDKATLSASMEGVDAVCCCTGTTAFPTLRWLGKNDPETNGYVGTKNLVELAAKEGKKEGREKMRRFVFVSSAGVKRYDAPPYSIMNAFGVLTAKEKAEELLKASGIPYTIVRPCRLTDAPYTSYDLNTLIKGESGARKEVLITTDEVLDGETSRAAVAESCLQALLIDFMADTEFSIESILGEGPASTEEWVDRFEPVVSK